MVLTPTFYIADFQTGALYDGTLPLEAVDLSSSLKPGTFRATLDCRKLGGSMAESRSLVQLLRGGKCTLVPVLEGVSTGVGNAPTSRALGEWWIADVADDAPSPFVELAGPEFAGYAREVLITKSWVGTAFDPVQTAREMLAELYSASQTVTVNLQSWVSHTGARVDVDARRTTTDYWSAIAALQESDEGPFEWMLRTGLAMDGWVPLRVTRTLEVGQPILSLSRPEIVLELTGPGLTPASVLSAPRSWSESRTASTVYGWGAGRGSDQIGNGRVFTSRTREPGEPVKTRMISVPDAMSAGELKRHTTAALKRMTPSEHVFGAVMPTDRYTPMTGEVYEWREDASWTRREKASRVRCVGWSWKSNGPDVYGLQLTEV